MSKKIQNPQTGELASITLQVPADGTMIEMAPPSGGEIHFTFDSSLVSFARDGDNLSLVTEGNGKVSLLGYFTIAEQDMPTFVMPDGTAAAGSDFIKSKSPDLETETCETSANASNSGIGEYLSDAGNLVGGVERLGSLGTFSWSSHAENQGRLDGLGAMPTSAFAPTEPYSPVDPVVIFGGYIRAVLYNSGNSTDPVTTSIFYTKGTDPPVGLNPAEINYNDSNPSGRYSVAISPPDGWDTSWINVSFNPATGRFEFTLTPEGVAEMARLGLSGQNLIDFIKVQVVDTHNSGAPIFEYNVQVVGSNNPNFNSHDQDAFDQQQGEGYPNNKQESIGEFHQGKDPNGSYNIVSSNNDDEIILNNTVLGGSQIHASGSADFSQMADDYNTILLNKGMNNQGGNTDLTSSNGTLRVHEGVLSSGNTASTSIHMGKGEVHISNAVEDGVSADGGRNSITGGTITIESTASGVSATSNGSNYIFGKDITISGEEAGIFASGGSINEVTGTGGAVTITGSINGLEALSGGRSDISAEGGSIAIQGSLYGVHALGTSSNNRVSIENGDINITGGTASGVGASNGGTNEVIGTGNSTITISGASGVSASGLGTLNTPASNAIIGGDGKVSITGQQGSAVSATNNGANYVFGKDMDIFGTTAGIFASGGSINEVTGTGGTVHITGQSGVEAGLGGRNDISAEDGAIIIDGSLSGVQANSGKNEIIGEGTTDITISGGLEGMSADGLNASNSAIATGGNVSIAGLQGNGLSATGNAASYVSGKNVGISGAEAGVFASGGSINEVTGNGGAVTITGGINGLEALTGGSNDISA